MTVLFYEIGVNFENESRVSSIKSGDDSFLRKCHPTVNVVTLFLKYLYNPKTVNTLFCNNNININHRETTLTHLFHVLQHLFLDQRFFFSTKLIIISTILTLKNGIKVMF